MISPVIRTPREAVGPVSKIKKRQRKAPSPCKTYCTFRSILHKQKPSWSSGRSGRVSGGGPGLFRAGHPGVVYGVEAVCQLTEDALHLQVLPLQLALHLLLTVVVVDVLAGHRRAPLVDRHLLLLEEVEPLQAVHLLLHEGLLRLPRVVDVRPVLPLHHVLALARRRPVRRRRVRVAVVPHVVERRRAAGRWGQETQWSGTGNRGRTGDGMTPPLAPA